MKAPDWMKYRDSDWNEIASVLQYFESLEPSVKALLGSMINGLLANLYFLINGADSPIEQLMALVLDKRMDETGINYHIEPQATVEVRGKRYRVDLLLEIHNGDECTDYAIECDGHAFHEKTKEQARRDKARERALQAKGITVIRFTGSEIWDNPWRCAEEVVRILLKNL